MTLLEEIVVKRKSKMPFLDLEKLKPKLKEIFENEVIPQIKKAKMEQTAVTFLVEQLDGENHLTDNEIKRIIQQSKEMEKQQIIESYCQGCFDMWKDNGIVPRETADEYYNETFKSE
jgi:hypothetical protein